MKLWIPVAIAVMALVAYAFFYAISSAETQGASSLGIANAVGLLGVVVALFAAGIIFRRATPQR
ncbi:MAG: hypothetical protein JRM73_03290 [Nitrososphaerota archaeon]|nr:hypothetical protein [Nitrososphaerota archaeon]